MFSNRAGLAFRMRSQPRSRDWCNNGGSEDDAVPKQSDSKPAMCPTVSRGVNMMVVCSWFQTFQGTRQRSKCPSLELDALREPMMYTCKVLHWVIAQLIVARPGM